MKRKSIHNLFYLVPALLLVATFLYNVACFFPRYWFGRVLIFHERDCRPIALEVGKQNARLANGLALMMGKIITVGLAPAILGPAMNVNGFSLPSGWNKYLATEKVLKMKSPEK